MTAAPQKPAQPATRKYVIHLVDGRKFICIDLQNDPPEEVRKQIREHFWRYQIERIE